MDHDAIRRAPMGAIWAGVFLVVMVFGLAVPPWAAIETLITEQGVGDEGAGVIAFFFGYTLPLSVGFGILALGDDGHPVVRVVPEPAPGAGQVAEVVEVEAVARLGAVDRDARDVAVELLVVDRHRLQRRGARTLT